MPSKSSTRPRSGLRELLADRRSELANAWADAWQTHLTASRSENEVDLDHLRDWMGEFLARFAETLGHGDRADAAEEPAAAPNGTAARAIEIVVHVRAWLTTRCSQLHLELSDVERDVLRDMLESTLLDVARRAKSETEQQERFIDMLAHDLRGPLGTIIFATSALARHAGLGEEELHNVTRTLHAADRMRRMVDELLAFASARSGLLISQDSIALDDLCRRLVDEARVAHPRRMITVASTGDAHGYWDEGRLAQVVQNLLENAVTHSPEDTAVRVTIHGEHEDAVRLAVQNGGEPISAEKLARLFDPFARSTPHATGSGLGLGLSIVREFVHAHGGTSRVTSTRDDGTTLWIELPRQGGVENDRGVARRSS